MNQYEGVLINKKVAILAGSGFEQVEMTEPRRALQHAGAAVVLVGPSEDALRGWKEHNWGDTFPVDLPLKRAHASDFDALMLPGGVINSDKLRMDTMAVRFVKDFFFSAKPVAAICHGAWILIDAGVVKGRTLTSYPSMKADLANAGAKWLDCDVVVDTGLVTSRRPADLPVFCKAMVEAFACEHYEMQKPMEAFKPVQSVR